MNRIEILVIDTNEERLQKITHQINGNEKWNGTAANSTEVAIEKFHQRNVDVVVIGNGIAEDEKKLQRIFTLQNPDVIIVKNNNHDLLVGAIQTALRQQQNDSRPTFSITDDALKNAVLPIIIQ